MTSRWRQGALAAAVVGGTFGVGVTQASPAAAAGNPNIDWGQTWDAVGGCNHCVTSGTDVYAIQRNLAADLYLDPSDVDGQYGPVTSNAIKAFQRDAGLTVDGIGGYQLYHYMYTNGLSNGTYVPVSSTSGEYCKFSYDSLLGDPVLYRHWDTYGFGSEGANGTGWEINNGSAWKTVTGVTPFSSACGG